MTAVIDAQTPTLIDFLFHHGVLYWKDWKQDMTARQLPTGQADYKFSMSGTCPHCNLPTVFMPVSSAHTEPVNNEMVCSTVMQCQGCMKLILGTAARPSGVPAQQMASYRYLWHFPIGKPNDTVANEVPKNISADFSEALRCRFVDAYNATVEMCRRALQASCFEKGAPDDKLVNQIDWLATRGVITAPLKDMAHRIRLGGNLGAHPPENPTAAAITINAEYADAVLEFSRDFFQHVYVMPERLKKYTFK